MKWICGACGAKLDRFWQLKNLPNRQVFLLKNNQEV